MKNSKIHIKIIIVCLLLTFILQCSARYINGFAVWYADTVYPVIVTIVGRVSGCFNISIVEILLYMIILFLIIYIIRHIKEVGQLILRIIAVVSMLLLIFTLNCGINYYNRPFSSYMDISAKGATKEGLIELCVYLKEKVNDASEKRENPGEHNYNKSWGADGVAAMEKLGMLYPKLGGYYPLPKPLIIPQILSVQHIQGVYSPFTVEANYNEAVVPYNIPHTICHELSHLKGFMREDEANFIGYLACIGSDNAEFVYSGYTIAFIYASNELAKVDPEKHREIYGELADKVHDDLVQNSEYWSRYDGRIAEASNNVNNIYLKANSQSDGIRSYGRMVDLLLSYYNYE